jgi:hypothetical protein
MASARKRAMIAHLIAGKGADQQIAAVHIGQGALDIPWAAHK